MTERKIQLKTEVSPEGAQQGFKQIEQAAENASRKVGQAAAEAGKAVDNIGSGGQEAAQKLDRQTKSMINSIQRLDAELQAGGRSSSAFVEIRAKQLGLNVEALAPALAALRKTEEAARAASASIGGMGVSAAQTAAALRGVPAQFTDIVSSLASGQQPLTVFLQQGGQLKDMFGGAGNAARALGGYVAGLINPFTLAAAAAAALAFAFEKGASESREFQRTLILSGQVAGVTAGQLTDMAAAIAALGASTQGRAAEVLNGIAGSADIGRENLERFVTAALQLEKAGGPAAEKTLESFRSLAKEPLQAALKLNEATNFLTVGTYEQIKALEQQGKTVEATKVAQEALFDSINGRAPQVAQSLSLIEEAWKGIKNVAGAIGNGFANIGRELGTEQAIQALQNRIASVRAGNEGSTGLAQLPQLQAELRALEQGAKFEAQSAYWAAERAKSVQAASEWDKQAAKYQTDGKRLADEILQIRTRGLAAGKSEKEVTDQIALAVERIAKAPAGGGKSSRLKDEEESAKAFARALGALDDIQRRATASSEGLSKTQAALRDIQADPTWATFNAEQQKFILRRVEAVQASEDLTAANKAGAKVAADAARDYEQYLKALTGSGDAVARQVQALQDEEAAAQIAATGRLSLKAAIEEVTIARLRDAQVAAMGNPDAVEAIQREIDARMKLRGAITTQDARKAADDAAKEWARAAEKISDSITDALMRGFESGKGFAQNLRDTVVNMFKTLVLRPIVSAVVSPVAGALTGALGLPGIASAATGASSLAGAAGLGGLAGGFGAFGSGITSGLSAYGAGGSLTGLLSTGVGGIFSGGLASGLGTLAGALGPLALGVGAIAALAKSLTSGGTPSYGSIYTIGTDGRNGGMLTPQTAGGYQLGSVYSAAGSTNQAVQDTVKQFTTSLAATVGAAFSAFGMQPGTVRAGFAADNDDPSIGRITIRDASGRALTDRTSRYAANSSTGFQQFAADAGKALRDALVAADLPGWADGLLNDLGAAPTVEAVQQMVQSLAQLRGVFTSFGGTLGLTQDEVAGLARAFGGVDALASGLSGYLSALYSDSERLTMAQESLGAAFQQLGQAVPANAAAYRALVDAQDLSTEAGRAAYASLVKLAPAFAEVTQAADQAAAQQEQLAQRRAAEGYGLETRLLQLQGDTAALRERELAALDPINRSLQQRIFALEDQQAVEQAATAAATAAAAERARLADQAQAEADSLDARLMQLIGDVAGLRARELAALTPANRALQERIYALEDAKAATEAANVAAQQQAALAQQVASQGESLMTRLLQLQGDTAALRAREIAALDPANRALQERIYALEDAQAAAQAAQALADQWAGVSETLEDEIARISGLNRTQATNLAQVQADFAVATAQARSGDKAAAERLPELSRTLLEMARGSARSALELSSVQASVVASLTQTADVVRGLAAGPLSNAQDAVQSLMPDTIAAQILAGDQAKTTTASTGQADMLAELRALRSEVVDLRAEARATATATAAISRLHQRWDGDGLLVRTDSDTPLTTTVI